MDSKGSQVQVRIYGDTAQERPVLAQTPQTLQSFPCHLSVWNRNLQISFPAGLWTGMKSSHRDTDRAQGSRSNATLQCLGPKPQPRDQEAYCRKDIAQSKPPQVLNATIPPPSTADPQSPHHFPCVMRPGDLPMVLQSEDFTKLLELCSLKAAAGLW
jgi:hypothetical protein